MGINPVGSWNLDPDFETQGGTQYKTSIDNAIRTGKRLADAFACHEDGTPAMNVLVNPGAVLLEGVFVEKPQQAVGFTAPTTNPRIDRVVVDSITGVAERVAGTESASPSAPAIPDEKIPIAQVALTVGMTAILNAHITDERLGGGATSVVSVKDRVTGNTTVESTLSETNIYFKNIPGGLLGSNKSLFLYLEVSELDISASQNCVIRFKYGGTTICSATFVADNCVPVSNAVMALECRLHAKGATNAQVGSMAVHMRASGAANPAMNNTNRFGYGTASEDSTVNHNLEVSVDFSSTVPSNKIVAARAHLRKE